MKNEILLNLDNPAQLEKLYRTDRSTFKQAFQGLPPGLASHSLTGFWNARLNFAKEDISWGTRKDLLFVMVVSILAGLIAKLPAFLRVSEEWFYTRNIGFTVFPALSLTLPGRTDYRPVKLLLSLPATLAGLIFIISFPMLLKATLQFYRAFICSCSYGRYWVLPSLMIKGTTLTSGSAICATTAT